MEGKVQIGWRMSLKANWYKFQAEIYINLLDDDEFDGNDESVDDDDNDVDCDEARKTSNSDVETESTLSTIHSRHVTPSHSKHTTPR